MSGMQTLVDTDNAQIEIQTTADVIKPVFAYAKTLLREAKVHFDDDGVHYTAVDPSNVAMVQMDVPNGVFESYDVDETTVGIDLKEVMKALRAGRKRQEDIISLSYEDRQLSTTVKRDYDGTEMDLQTNLMTIDPDAIRQEPDIPNIEFAVDATLNRTLFEDAIDAVDEVSDYVQFTDNDGDLMISGESDVSDARGLVKGVANGEGANSLFSLDYVKQTVKGLKTVGVDEFTVELGEEIPMNVAWDKEINGCVIEGSYFQAPRIKSE